MTSALQQVQKQLAEVANTLGYAIEQEEQVFLRQANGQASQNSLSKGRASREGALISEIDAAYKILATTRRKLARAETARRRHEQRVRVNNAEALASAKNERVAQLYLDGVLDTDEYRKLADAEKGAEIDHFEARAEVDRLQLVVKLLRAGPPAEQESAHP